MASRSSGRVAAFLAELPGALMLALLTAVVTLILAIVVSAVLGGENQEHRISARCAAHDTIAMIREIVRASDTLSDQIDLSRYPVVDISGIDCSVIYQPLETTP